ncbi:putative acetyltransferase NATA1-like [Forsythia ovata]|uniref:Acetyltransferase NATA1-like n=1 Tax=Forsythia ovata TaxID=205694 RepID=A0ABD1NZB0_9LAMI
MAVFERLAHLCKATQSPSPIRFFSQTLIGLLLHSIFFFSSFLTFHSFPHPQNAQLTPILKSIHLELPIEDPEREAFRSKAIEVNVLGNDGVLQKKGLGKILLSTIVSQAAKMGYGRVEWVVLD